MVPRRLSSFEYVNSVRDLFGIELEGLIEFPPDEETMGFDNNARALQASPIHIERYFESAETIAAIARCCALSPHWNAMYRVLMKVV